ncbi:acetyltransferase [Legionella jamestowniensis]|uniref:Acetyltransferase n=1 Tax=Legionella jamestowniensis TaxID=455 RepID=A0ABX2XSU3_9GAMM|nr:acetyltransferase [Legionella jamestowniensis]OCH97558.1 acetyltransferase [Legionella jamestowniensis]
MRTLAIWGASGHGKVVADAALSSCWENIVFFDDRWPELERVGSWNVVGNGKLLFERTINYDAAIVAIGDNVMRMQKTLELIKADITLATVTHSSAIVSPHAAIGDGSVIFAGAVVNIDAQLGVGCIVNTGATVDHDCELGNGVHISPGANLAGNVAVGNLSWVGIGASVRQNIIIGAEVIVGAGATVVKNIPSYCTVIGVPAEIIKIRN